MKKLLSLLTATVTGIVALSSAAAFTPQTNPDFSYNSMFADGQPITYTGTQNGWVTVEDGQMKLGDEEFVSIGFTNYSHSNASYEFIENIMLDAKRAGFNVIRVCDMVSRQYSDGLSASSESWKMESNWVQTDFIISTAEKLGMKVLLDLSTFRKYFYERSPRVDSYDPASFVYWDEVVDFITQRTNTFTGKKYCNDPTVFSYAILGEPVPFGGELNDWSGGENASRNAKDVTNAILHIAKRLKEKAPYALIQTGGLLHIIDHDGFKFTITSDDVENWGLTLPAGSQQYYTDVLFNSSYIDYATIHIYPINYANPMSNYFDENDQFKPEMGSVWEDLDDYVDRWAAFGKPLMIEEFGIDRSYANDAQAGNYMQYCFDKMTAAGIRHAIVWNLGYGKAFDVGPQVPQVWNVFQSFANSWGTTSIQGLPFGPLYPCRSENIEREALISDFESEGTVYVGGGNQVVGEASLETGTSTHGDKSIKMPVNLQNAYGWQDFGLSIENNVQISDYDYLAVDAFIPAQLGSIYIRMGYKADWVGYIETDDSYQTNYLIPGQWKTLYLPLKNVATNAHGSCYFEEGEPAANAYVNTMEFSIRNVTTTGDTYILFDNLRLVKVK